MNTLGKTFAALTSLAITLTPAVAGEFGSAFGGCEADCPRRGSR